MERQNDIGSPNTRGRRPARCRCTAADTPWGPAPMTATSRSGAIVPLCLARGRAGEMAVDDLGLRPPPPPGIHLSGERLPDALVAGEGLQQRAVGVHHPG